MSRKGARARAAGGWKDHGIADLSVGAGSTRAKRVLGLLRTAMKLLEDGVALSDTQRKFSPRFCGAEEIVALDGILAYAEARPELFVSLADEDEGHDPKEFEIGLVRDRLANAASVQHVLDE